MTYITCCTVCSTKTHKDMPCFSQAAASLEQHLMLCHNWNLECFWCVTILLKAVVQSAPNCEGKRGQSVPFHCFHCLLKLFQGPTNNLTWNWYFVSIMLIIYSYTCTYLSAALNILHFILQRSFYSFPFLYHFAI